MSDDLSLLRAAPFSEAVESVEKLLSSSNRAFLIGAGCSKCAGLPLTSELKDLVLQRAGGSTRKILEGVIQAFTGAKSSTIEEYLSELVDLMAIARRRVDCEAEEQRIKLGDEQYSIEDLTAALREIRISIVESIKVKADVSTHRRFIGAVHHQLQSGKRDRSNPTEYLVLNYDTLIEDALALEQVPYSDGLAGGATGWWDLTALSPDRQQARVIKLHGSIDWVVLKGEIFPRRIRDSILPADVDLAEGALIWPALTKYRETERDPFAQLAKIMREILHPPEHIFPVLIVCGYRFGDAHINLELYRALKESEQRLTVLVFTEMERPEGVLKLWHEDPALRDQVRIHAKNGFFHTVDSLSQNDLPWWKFEVLTRLLGGER